MSAAENVPLAAGSEPSGSVPGVLELVGAAPLDGASIARASTKHQYRLTFAEYARRFGLGGVDPERKLKRWVAIGREKDPVDWPPFDSPADLAAWWGRNMKWRVPAWMELLAQTGEPPVAAAAGGETAARGKGADELPADFALHDLAQDAGDAEKALWQMAQGFLAEMQRASRASERTRWWNAYNEYRKLLDELRKWEKDRMAKRLQKGEVAETAIVTESLTRMFGAVAQSFTGVLLDLARQLRPDLDPAEARRIIYPLRDRVFAGLKEKENRFSVPVPPMDTAA